MSEVIVLKLTTKDFASIGPTTAAASVLLECAYKIVSTQPTVMDFKDLKIEFRDGDSLYAIVHVFEGCTLSVSDVQKALMKFFSQSFLNLISDADVQAVAKTCEISVDAAALLLNEEVLKDVYFARVENIFEPILKKNSDFVKEVVSEPVLQLGPVMFVGEASNPHRCLIYHSAEEQAITGWSPRFAFQGVLGAEGSERNCAELSNFMEIHIGEALNPHRMMIFEDRELADRHGWTYKESLIVSRTPRMGMVPIAVGIAFDPHRCMLTPNCTDHTLNGFAHMMKFYAHEVLF